MCVRPDYSNCLYTLRARHQIVTTVLLDISRGIPGVRTLLTAEVLGSEREKVPRGSGSRYVLQMSCRRGYLYAHWPCYEVGACWIYTLSLFPILTSLEMYRTVHL